MAKVTCRVQEGVKFLKSFKKNLINAGVIEDTTYETAMNGISEALKQITCFVSLMQVVKTVEVIMPEKKQKAGLAATERELWKALEREHVPIHEHVKQ